MKKIKLFVYSSSIFFLLVFSHPNHETRAQAVSLWEPIVDGIEYREFFFSGPNQIYVARMDRNNHNLILDSSIGQGRISGGSETVSDMAARYDQAINYWDEEWGMRNKVVVAINGYFFDPDSGIPWSGQVHSGWYAKRFSDRESGSGVVWKMNRSLFIGGCIVHPKNRQVVNLITTNSSITFDGINVPRGEDELIIYTPQYDTNTQTNDEGIEILVEISRPMMIMPSPAAVSGVVTDIRDKRGNTLIPFDYIVLSASGSKRRTLLHGLKIGDEIEISQEIKHFESDCKTPSSLGWEKTYAAIGASFLFLKDGRIGKSDDLGAIFWNARTAIAYNDKYIYFIVVDDRETFHNQGMSITELAAFAKYSLGAVWGAALDGGGSSTMFVDGVAKNKSNPIEMDQNDIERVVANGLMMVAIQPMEKSEKFLTGDTVITKGESEIQMYLGPGTNYEMITSIPVNLKGVVMDNNNNLNGILAKGVYWWKVAFGEVSGWVMEQNLIKNENL